MEIDDMFDVFLLVIFLIIGVTNISTAMVTIEKTFIVDSGSDKLALTETGDIVPVDVGLTAEDILLMSVIADEYQPYPSNMVVNEDLLEFNNKWKQDSNTNINNFYNATIKPVLGGKVESMYLSLDGGKLQWKVIIK